MASKPNLNPAAKSWTPGSSSPSLAPTAAPANSTIPPINGATAASASSSSNSTPNKNKLNPTAKAWTPAAPIHTPQPTVINHSNSAPINHMKSIPIQQQQQIPMQPQPMGLMQPMPFMQQPQPQYRAPAHAFPGQYPHMQAQAAAAAAQAQYLQQQQAIAMQQQQHYMQMQQAHMQAIAQAQAQAHAAALQQQQQQQHHQQHNHQQHIHNNGINNKQANNQSNSHNQTQPPAAVSAATAPAAAPTATPVPATAPTTTNSVAPVKSADPLIPSIAVTTKPRDAVPAAKRVRKLKSDNNETEELPRSTTTPAAVPATVTTVTDTTSTTNTTTTAPVTIPTSIISPSAAASESAAESALNNSLSRKYAREFLLKFQNSPATAEPPAGLLASDLDIIITKSIDSNAPPGAGAGWRGTPSLRPGSNNAAAAGQNAGLRPGASMRPNNTNNNNNNNNNNRNIKGNSNNNSNSNKPNSGSGGVGGGRRPDLPMDIEILPLTQSDNRYQILKDIPPSDKLIRSLTAILNKLTPEKFDILVDQVLLLGIDSVADLRDCVSAVFEKALAEPNFSPTYAEFCCKLAEKLPTFAADASNTSAAQADSAAAAAAVNTNPDSSTSANSTVQVQSFKRLILNQCQSEFETDHTPELTALTTEESKNELKSQLKRRTLGTIRFIGELFVRSMLASSIIRHCIVYLLGDINIPIEEDCEALCKLFDTVGQKMDNKSNKEFLDNAFNNMNKLSANKEKLSSRIRFMIQDTEELRARGWIQRRQADTAKKIAEIHKDNANLISPTAASAAASASAINKPVHDKYAPGSAANRAANTVSAKGRDRYALLPQTTPRRTGAGAGSGSGSSATTGSNTDEWETVASSKTPRRPGTTIGNNNTTTTVTAPQQSPNTRQLSIGSNKPDSTSTGDADKPIKINTFALLNGDADDEHHTTNDDNSIITEDSESKSNKPKSTAATSIDLVNSTKSLLKEYFSIEDLTEATVCAKELNLINNNENQLKFILTGLQLVVDLKDKERQLLPKLLIHFYQQKLITNLSIINGLIQFFALCDDFAIDFPRCTEQAAIITGALIAESIITLDELFDPSIIFTKVTFSSNSDWIKLLLNVLLSIKRLSSDSILIQLIQQSKKFQFLPFFNRDSNSNNTAQFTLDQLKSWLIKSKLELLTDIVKA